MTKIGLFKKYKKYIFLALLIAGIVIFFNSRSNLTASVRKVEVKNREVKRTISASGIVKSENQADLSFLANGVVSKVNVSEGDIVKKGQLLAYLDPSTQIQSVQSYKDARDIKIRQKELFEEEERTNKKLLGGQDSYDIKLREYEEALSQAEAGYQAQVSLLSNYYIYAPFDGSVVEVLKKEGETATVGVPVVKLADLNGIVFEVVLDQEDYGLVKEGQATEVELDSYENSVFMGSVNKLPLSADQSTGSFIVKIRFDKDDKNVRLGMTGDAFMITDKTDGDVQSLTFNEISYDKDDKPFVWIVENGKLKKFYVEVGLEGDLYTEIKNDLGGKTVVVPAKEDSEIEEGFIAKIIN